MVSEFRVFIIVALWAIFFGPVDVYAKDTITWLEAAAPPFFIHQGEQKGEGYEDIVTDIIHHNLPDYNHRKVVANISRHYHEFKNKENVCNVGLYKTKERESFLHYSMPSFFTLPTVVVIKKEDYEKFGKSKNVRLNLLLQNEKIVIGHAKDRSYGKFVDEIVTKYEDQDSIYVFSGNELSLNFFKMLDLGRIDGLISLPEEAMYQAERLGIRDKIMTLTIMENQQQPEAWFSHVACSKTEWGQQVIDKVNSVLLEQRSTNEYRAAYERWLDETSLDNYRKLYQEVFLSAVK